MRIIEGKYGSLFRASLQNSVAYRSNFFINSLTGIVFVTALFYLWKAIYADRVELGGFTWNEMKAYLLIVFISNTLITWYSETAISRKILDGSVAMDLLKPLDFQKSRFYETLGTSITEGGVCVGMTVIVLLIFTGVQPPGTAVGAILFVISMAFSWMIKFGIVYLAGLCCFWTTSAMGIGWARAAITNLFSGALIPITMFPDWLKTFSSWLPFQGIVFIPASLYLDRLHGLEAWRMLGLQLFWVVALWLAGKWLWKWAVRKVTIHGG